MVVKLLVCSLAFLAAEPNVELQKSGTPLLKPAQAMPAPAPAGPKAEAPATAPAAQRPAELRPPTAEGTQPSAAGGHRAEDKAAEGGGSPANKAEKSGEPADELLPIEANIISYTNQERQRYGLPPLEVDRRLMLSARRHCAWMARRHALVHTSQPVAENIAMGQRHSHEAVRDWMNSPGHRANILNRNHRRIGVAAYRTPSGTIFWCQQFGR